MSQLHSQVPINGLILTGGGARAAYQVGVLSAISDILQPQRNPFPVIVGTSAGAINAAALACGAEDISAAVQRLTGFWQGMRTERIYRSDWQGVLAQAARFITGGLLGLAGDAQHALLNNAPLGELLAKELDFCGIERSLAKGCLHAVAVTAFDYQHARAVTFYQSIDPIKPWTRHRREGVSGRLGYEHLLASSALPLLFEPVPVGERYCGDGALGQTAPISPALHLGANRVLVIGLRHERKKMQSRNGSNAPSLAQVAGQLLDSALIDSLDGDLELLERMNQLAAHLPDNVGEGRLAHVDTMVLSPSQPLADLALSYRHELPKALRPFLRGSGATGEGGGEVLSYLLFEPGYCNALIRLGYEDTLRRKEELLAFLGHGGCTA